MGTRHAHAAGCGPTLPFKLMWPVDCWTGILWRSRQYRQGHKHICCVCYDSRMKYLHVGVGSPGDLRLPCCWTTLPANRHTIAQLLCSPFWLHPCCWDHLRCFMPSDQSKAADLLLARLFTSCGCYVALPTMCRWAASSQGGVLCRPCS